jgi:hypothetical protein
LQQQQPWGGDVAGDNEVKINASVDDDVTATLARIGNRLDAVENQLKGLGVTGEAAGKALDSGMEKAERATGKVKRAAGEAVPPVKKLGDEAAKTGLKAAVASDGLEKFANKARKASKGGKGLGGVLMAY